jgi:nicotinamidase-related amidase
MTNKSKRPIWDAADAALVLIDYQPEMFAQLRSSDPKLVELNVRFLARIAKAFKMPVVLSSVGVTMGVNKPTIETLTAELPDLNVIDRSSMDAWEDEAFLKAIKATGKKRLIFAALYTEICLTFPVIEALADGYEVMTVNDAVAGLSLVAHDTAIQRMIQAGAIPTTAFALSTELFRDWKTPFAAIARPILYWYAGELTALNNLNK